MSPATSSTDPSKLNWRALVLAGQRLGKLDPVASAAGVEAKALAPTGGASMLHHVCSAITGLDKFPAVSVIGNSQLLKQHEDFANLKNIEWIQQHQSSPVASVQTYLRSITERRTALFITTGDHPLLTSEWVAHFLDESLKQEADVVVGVANFEGAKARREGRRRTLYKFTDGAFSGCNMFAVLTPHVEQMLSFCMEMERSRKRPLRTISLLGWRTLTRYFTGRLSLEELLWTLSSRVGCKIACVTMPDRLAATDVDTVEDWHHVRRIFDEKDDSS